jgi:hypothetical protein
MPGRRAREGERESEREKERERERERKRERRVFLREDPLGRVRTVQ